jgi:hypothetical protein
MDDIIYRGWETQGWRHIGRKSRATAPGAFALRQSLWTGPNTHIRGDPTTLMTNTISIL